jgi:hypothetical protein
VYFNIVDSLSFSFPFLFLGDKLLILMEFPKQKTEFNNCTTPINRIAFDYLTATKFSINK